MNSCAPEWKAVPGPLEIQFEFENLLQIYLNSLYFSDINTSLADIMEEKIRSVEVQYAK
jgi:hypothetical protein